jgi:biotin transport system ATP-binding protein
MITCRDVGVHTDDGVELLRGVTLNIDHSRTAIIGANGSGKTTLARLFNGLTRPTAGVVTVDGLDVATKRREVQRLVGFVFANADHQLVYPTPLEDVALSLRARGVAVREAQERARAQLDAVGLAHKADQAIHTLSGGEKHLVALCAVLVLEPRWLVIDEPTTTLDLINRRRVIDVLATLPQRLVVVSHDLDLVRTMDAAVLVDAASVVATGASDAIAARYVAAMDAR